MGVTPRGRWGPLTRGPGALSGDVWSPPSAGPIRRTRSLLAVLSVLLLGAAGTGAAPAVSALAALGASVRPGAPITGPRSGYQLSTERMPDGTTVLLRWNPCQTITYKVNVAVLPAAVRPAVLGEVRTAFGRLGAVSGLRFGYRGTTAEVPRAASLDRQSAEIVVAVTTRARTDFPIGGGTLGYGGRSWYWWWSGSGRAVRYGAAITRGFVVLDATGTRGLRGGFGPGLTRGNLLQHELGHAVGLDHAGSRAALMYPELSTASPNGYAPDDRAGLVRVGRSGGCLNVPSTLPSPDLG